MLRVLKLDHEGNSLRMLKLRNPHGANEWKGDWSDKSDLWTDDLKDQLGWEEKNDGSFFIDYKDFIEHFCKSEVHIILNPRVPIQRLKERFVNGKPQEFHFTLDSDLDCTSEFFAFKAENCGPKYLEFRNRKLPWRNSLIGFEVCNSDGDSIRETKRGHWRD
jgi:hypothetical protein